MRSVRSYDLARSLGDLGGDLEAERARVLDEGGGEEVSRMLGAWLRLRVGSVANIGDGYELQNKRKVWCLDIIVGDNECGGKFHIFQES